MARTGGAARAVSLEGAGRGGARGSRESGAGEAAMPARRGRPRRAPNRGAAGEGRVEAAWREFAASFAQAGMVPPGGAGLAAAEAAEGAAVLLLGPQQVRRPDPTRPRGRRRAASA